MKKDKTAKSKNTKKSRYLLAYVVKLGDMYANGARAWRYTQKRARFFRYDGQADLGWAKEHLKSLIKGGDTENSTPERLKKMRIVKIMRLAR